MDSGIGLILNIPFISEMDGIIINLSSSFMELSGFNREDLMDKPLDYVWCELLRISRQPDFSSKQQETLLFTKSLEARWVFIEKQECSDSREIKYYIDEIPGSRFEDKNQFLVRLINDNKTGIGVFSAADFILLKASQRYLDYFPEPFNTKAMFYGRSFKDAVPAFEGSSFEGLWIETAKNNETVHCVEKQGVMLGGKNSYWDYSLTPISVEGEVKYIVAMLEDVTEGVMNREHIKKQSDIIEKQKRKLDAIIENMTEAVYTLDREGNCTLANKAAFSMLGTDLYLKPQERYQPGKYFSAEGRELSYDEMVYSRVLKGERVLEEKRRVKTPSGIKYLGISGTPIFDEKGEVELVILCVRDITRRESQSQIIREQKEELEAFFDNIDEAIYICDANKNYYLTNKSAREYFPNEELKKFGKAYNTYKYYDFDGNEIPLENMPILRLYKGETVKNYKMTMRNSETVRHICVNGVPIYDNRGDIKFVTFSCRDITEDINRERIIKNQQDLILKREIEKGEALKEAMELKDEFLYLITHEFRTPMAVVSSALQVLNLNCSEEITERVGKYLGIIKQNTNRQLRLVNNLLDITRISSGNIKMNISGFDAVNVISKIVDSIKLYAQQKNVNIYFSTSLSEKYIYSDEEKLERIILNLLSNALKFTPNGRSIYVKLAEKKYRNKNVISIDVQDEGIGIPREKQKMIFERFGQVDSSLSRRAEGTGLGLHLVKLLVKALDGEIILNSRVDKGSTFTVILPLNNRDNNGTAVINSEMSCIPTDNSDRVIESAAIEFSDIYY